MPKARPAVKLSELRDEGVYTLTQFAGIMGCHLSTAIERIKRHKLPRTLDGDILGITIRRYLGRDSKALATVTNAEWDKRWKDAAKEAKSLV